MGTISMPLWDILSVLLVCCASTVVTDASTEEMGSASPLETMASCHISHDCNMTEDGVVCHLTKHHRGHWTVYRLNSRGSILFQLMKGTQGGVEQKKMEMNTCSCQIPGYGKEFSNETSLLFVYNTRGIFFYEGHDIKTMHKVTLDFSGEIRDIYVDMSQCIFIWMNRSPRKKTYSSMCFDGKDRKKIFEGEASCIFYDHIRRLYFCVGYRKRSYVVRVFSDAKNSSDIFESRSRLDCRCFAGHAASQTLVICMRAGIKGSAQHTLYTLHYKNIYELVPRKVLEVYCRLVFVAVISLDKLAIQYEKDTVYLYDIASNTKKAIVNCPFRSLHVPRVGVWDSQVFIKCTDRYDTYFYFATLEGVQTMHMKTLKGARFVTGTA